MSDHRMHQGLAARAEQQLLLQPKLLQSIEVLQVPAQDLEAWLQRAAEENEALRVEAPAAAVEGEGREWTSAERSASPRGSSDATERHDEMLRNHPDRSSGLEEELAEQLALLELDEERRAWLDFLVGCLDDNGYLSPSDDELLQLATQSGLRPDAAELGCAIAALQGLEPRGVGGRDMIESLLLQLDEDAEDYGALCRLLEEFLDDVAKNRLPAVARGLGIELDELGELLGRLRHLDPRPGLRASNEESFALRPDIVVEPAEGGGFDVRLARGSLPTVSIDPEVAELSRGRELPKDVRVWARDKVERARWIVDAVEQRGATLLRLASVVCERQRAFLEHGPGHLRPLSMTELAAELELHVSTISRTVSGKHVQCPWGILPLKHFFQKATGDGEAPARDDLQAIVQAIFDAEDPSDPLSDDAVAEELARRGHEVARRTVAKYRRQLGIPSSYKRRRYV